MVERALTLVEQHPRNGHLALAGLLAIAVLTRAIGLGQPIVENYVGRQVPTAMVARNLERGSGFLTPRIDVAPLPNLFLVEPPIFASLAVGLRRLSGLRLPLEQAGRLVSAIGIALGAWGLFGLSSRREGVGAGLLAAAAFLCFPVTIRYGRSFQPDALMLGCLIAGMSGWDEFERKGGIGSLAAGVFLLAVGLALKVVSVFILVPLLAAVVRDRKPWKFALAAATLLPVSLWYVHAAVLIAAGEGSRASADNGAIWLRVLVPSAWFSGETYRHVARFLGVRAFTPLGPILAVAGFLRWPDEGDPLWRTWGAAGLAALVMLAAKLHHEYYWLAIAPVMAVGVSRTIVRLARLGIRGQLFAGATAAVMAVMAIVLAVSTWKVPPEWATLRIAALEVKARVPPESWVVAPEALLFEADRRGCRLELTASAARRASGEWGTSLDGEGPAALVEFYRRHGATYFADVSPEPIGADRRALHEAVKRRYNVLVDRPGVLIATLHEPREDAPHGNGTGQPADASAAQARGDDP